MSLEWAVAVAEGLDQIRAVLVVQEDVRMCRVVGTVGMRHIGPNTYRSSSRRRVFGLPQARSVRSMSTASICVFLSCMTSVATR